MSIRHFLFVQNLVTIPAGVLQNVTNKSLLVCYEREKYAFWVTPKPPGFHDALRAALWGKSQS